MFELNSLAPHLLSAGTLDGEGAASSGLGLGSLGHHSTAWLPHPSHCWPPHPGRFIYDWVYSGVFRDVYGEFMIQVNHDYLGFRGRWWLAAGLGSVLSGGSGGSWTQASVCPVPRSDKSYWTHGYVLLSKEAEDCVPAFLKHIAHDVYVCGKTINLLKLCCPRVSEEAPRAPRALLALPRPLASELRSRPVIPVPPRPGRRSLPLGQHVGAETVVTSPSGSPEFHEGSCLRAHVHRWEGKQRHP